MARKRDRQPFRSLGGGRFAVDLPVEVRELLASLPAQLRQLIVDAPDDPWLQRLFPPAYNMVEDAEKQAEWRRLMAADLHERRLAQLDALALTADATELSEGDLHVWSQAVNDLRLYLGTRLDVSEGMDVDDWDQDDPELPLFGLYVWLSAVQEEIVHALSEAL